MQHKDDLIRQAFDAEHFRRNGHELIDLLANFLHSATSGELPHALPWQEPQDQYRHWEEGLEKGGDTTPQALFAEVLESSIRIHHPRYMGHQVSPSAPLAALAGLADGFLNNGMGVYEMGAAGTAIERVVVKAVAKKMGFGQEADGVMTSGGSLANLTALLAARSARSPSPAWQEGQKERLAVLVSEEAHYCVDRAVRIMGWGEGGIIKVPADETYRMRTELLPEYLERARRDGRHVIAVVGSACTTSTGSFDRLDVIADFCRGHGLWFHVDGAHGGALAFSPPHRHLLAGIERADSVVMDFHKMLLTPVVATALIFRDGSQAFRTFSQRAQYLWNQESDEEWFNLAKRTFECTKLMMGLKAYTLLRIYGPELWEQYLGRVMEHGRRFAALVRETEGFELAAEPQCNIVCFRYKADGMPEEAANVLNGAIRRAIVEEGRFYIVKTDLRGRVFLRVTLSNPFTAPGDMQALLARIQDIRKTL